MSNDMEADKRDILKEKCPCGGELNMTFFEKVRREDGEYYYYRFPTWAREAYEAFQKKHANCINNLNKEEK